MNREEAPLHPLRRARLSLDRPLTQVQLADLVGISKSTIERAESGKAIRVDNIQLLCAYLKKDAHELGLLPVSAPGKPRQEAIVSVRQSRGATPDATSGTCSSDSRTDALPQVRPSEIEDIVNRHDFIYNAVRAGGALLFTAPDGLLHTKLVDRFNRALKKPSTIDTVTLNERKATAQSYRRFYEGGSVASPYLLEATTGHFKLVVQFLQGSLLPSTRSALSAIASETAQLAGRLSADVHLYDQAQAHYNLALVTAQEANNDTLYATGLEYIGWFMKATNRPEEAIVYLEETQRIAIQCDAFSLLCWSAAEQAEAHADVAMQSNAQQPDDRDCLRSLETVNRFVERIQPAEENFGLSFDASRQAAYHGSCYMRLQRPCSLDSPCLNQ
jgi:transcriptional regulator with XRE-family HTH domain